MRFREIVEGAKPPKVTQAQIHAWAADASEKYGVPIQLVMHVLNKETGGAANPDYATGAISDKGAGGVMQIMPGTAKDNNVKNVFDPKQNVYAGVKILAGHYNNFDQNAHSALAAYNSGGGTVNSYLTGKPLKVTQADGTIKTINPKGIKTTDGVPPYKETQNYIYGKKDAKGNMVGGYDPNAVYDVAALKSALPASSTTSAPIVAPIVAPVVKPDPAAVGQANVDKMAAWDRSKNAPVTPPSQSQVRAIDNKIDAATPKPAPTPVTNPAQIVNQPRDFRPAVPGSVPDALKTPNQIGNQPGGSTPSAPIVKAEPSPKPIVAPAPSPTPVAKPIVAPATKFMGGQPGYDEAGNAITPTTSKPVAASALKNAPAVDQTGGAGKIGPTVSALKGNDPNNPLNKSTAPVTKVEPEPAEISTDRLKALSGGSPSNNTLPVVPQYYNLKNPKNLKTSSADLVPDIKTAQADTDTDDLEKMAVAENFKTINTQRYSFLLGL